MALRLPRAACPDLQPLAELLPERTAPELAVASSPSHAQPWICLSTEAAVHKVTRADLGDTVEQAIVVPDWSLRRGIGVAAG